MLATPMVLRAALEKKEEKERVRVSLLRAALRLAAVHGFASLGLREVAREAGIAPTSFYRHFADMEELGMALIREMVGGVRRELAARALAAPRAEAVAALIEAAFDVTARDPELMRFLLAERVGALAGFRALLRAEQAALAHALQAAISGEPSPAELPPSPLSEACISLLLDACARFLDGSNASRVALREPLRASIQTLLSASRGDRA